MTNEIPPVPDAVLVLVTFPDEATARTAARRLVEDRLVACVNIVSGVTSVYAWEGEIQEDGEVLALMKTTVAAVPGLETTLVSLHPYDTPEFVVLAPSHVEARYLAWLGSVTGPESLGGRPRA